ncbi:MAG: ATP-binding protein, partial [Nitrosomonadales bacterium]|nr:ATP-binding protein [Nitrosomonadales bacterium]
VLNELISNAVKHGGGENKVEIVIRPELQPHLVKITITNSGQLPAGFEYPHQLGGGSGLLLISSLMPPNGSSLDWAQKENKVTVSFRLGKPIVNFEHEDDQ